MFFTLNYYKRCRWVESHSQEYIRVESRFDNSIDELSPILITGIVEMSPTLISRIFQCTQGDTTWGLTGKPSLSHSLQSQYYHLYTQEYDRTLAGIKDTLGEIKPAALYFCYWPYTPCCLVVGNFWINSNFGRCKIEFQLIAVLRQVVESKLVDTLIYMWKMK